MLSTLKYTIYYAMDCVLLLKFFCHYVILEKVAFFFTTCVFFPSLLFSRELVVLKTVLYNR